MYLVTFCFLNLLLCLRIVIEGFRKLRFTTFSIYKIILQEIC